MLIAKEESIRRAIAFPKTQAAICPLTSAPSSIDRELLKELRISAMRDKNS